MNEDEFRNKDTRTVAKIVGSGGSFMDKPETLRDRFAMSVLTGLVGSLDPNMNIAEISYQIADEMMEARKK